MAELSKKVKVKNVSPETHFINLDEQTTLTVQSGETVIVSSVVYEKKLKDIPAVWEITGVYEEAGIE